MPWYEKRIKSGKLLEIEKYFATRDGKRLPRSANEKETTEEQDAQNAKRSEKKLKRLINANFARENGDLFITLTYAGEVTEIEAHKAIRNFMARMRRLRAKKGLDELKAITITELQSKWHHHIIVSGGLTLEEVDELWQGKGRTRCSLLDATYTGEEIARYLTAEHKKAIGRADGEKPERQKYARRWNATRNLEKPVVDKKEIKRPPSATVPKAPKGYRILPDWFVGCDWLGNIFTYSSYVREGQANAKKQNNNGSTAGAGGKRRAATADTVGTDGKRKVSGTEKAVPHTQRGKKKPDQRRKVESRGIESGCARHMPAVKK